VNSPMRLDRLGLDCMFRRFQARVRELDEEAIVAQNLGRNDAIGRQDRESRTGLQ